MQRIKRRLVWLWNTTAGFRQWAASTQVRWRAVLMLAFAVGLLGSTVAADTEVERQIGSLFGNRDANRSLVLLLGVLALGWIGLEIWNTPRPKRKHGLYAVVWLIGMVTIVGWVGMLPNIPVLATVQQVDLQHLDPLAQAALQWGAFWTVAMLLVTVFTGPHMNLGRGALIWLLGVLAGAVIADTLPEGAVPPLVLVPVATMWAAIVFIGGVYGVQGDGQRRGRAGAVAPLPQRAVWASLALVLVVLCQAEFASYVTLDHQVNADHAVTRQSVDDVLRKLDLVDKNVVDTSNALRTKGGDSAKLFQAVQDTIRDVGEAVAGAIVAAEITGKQAGPLPIGPQPVAAPVTPDVVAANDLETASVGQAAALPTAPPLNGAAAPSANAAAAQAATVTQAERATIAVIRLQKANDTLQALLPRLRAVDLTADGGAATAAQMLNQDVRSSVGALRREARLAHEVLIGADLPTAGVFLWVAAMFAAVVLFPWVLFVLFLLQKTQSRAREVLLDLCLLDGSPPPAAELDQPFRAIPMGSLLDRVLGDWFQRKPPRANVPTVREVQNALVEQAFSEQEYLVGLALLTVIVAAGWFNVFYPRGGLGLAATISQGADAWQLWAYLRSGLTPLTAGLAGGYFWCAYALVRRYLDSDLYPAAFIQCSVQLVLAFVLSLMFSIAVPPVAQLTSSAGNLAADSASGLGSHVSSAIGAGPAPAAAPSTSSSTTTTPSSTTAITNAAGGATAAVQTTAPTPPVEAIIIVLAFVGGVSISAGFTQLLALIRVLLKSIGLTGTVNPLADQAQLTKLDGIDVWTEARLAEEGVENIQALANAPIQRLVLRTHFTTQRLVDWVDQALLYVHTANWPGPGDDRPAVAAAAPPGDGGGPGPSVAVRRDLFSALRAIGICNATDLLAAGGWLRAASKVNLEDADRRQQTLQIALKRVLPDEDSRAIGAAVYTTCQAVIESPNWVRVANFRRSSRAGLGPDTSEWIADQSPVSLPPQVVPNGVDPESNGQGHEPAAAQGGVHVASGV